MTAADGKTYPMCGVIEGSSQNTGKLGRFGYITVSGKSDTGDPIISGLSIKGHEFHYYDSDNNGEDAVAVKPGTGRSWDCMHAGKTLLAGYPHLYYPSCPELIERLKDRMLEHQRACTGADSMSMEER
jgi:cobyrinic acid a,c-diamide synthase